LFFKNTVNVELIEKLKNKGVQFEMNEHSSSFVSDKLQGKSFVVSGVLTKFSREQVKKMIEENGGKNVSALSAKTDFLLAGYNMGPEKKKKAAKLQIPVITEDDFLKMLE
jgi:DNA ligase (NAD+)